MGAAQHLTSAVCRQLGQRVRSLGWCMLLVCPLTLWAVGCHHSTGGGHATGAGVTPAPAPVLPVTGVSSSQVGYTLGIDTQWQLPSGQNMRGEDAAAYDRIEIFVDTVRVATLPGDATSYATDGDDYGQELQVCVVGVVDEESADACALPIVPVELPAVEDLLCNPIGKNGAAALTWELPPDENGDPDAEVYDEIRIFVDEVLEDTLDGDATTYSLLGWTPGESIDVTVEGYVELGEIAAGSDCVVEFPVLAPVENLLCTAVGFDGAALLGWDLPGGEAYDEIAIIIDDDRDSETVIAGDATGYSVTDEIPGDELTFTVEGRRGGASAGVDCIVSLPVLPPVEDLECEFSGEDAADLHWVIPEQVGAYDEIQVLVDDLVDHILPGDVTRHTVEDLLPDTDAAFEVIGVLDDEAASAFCALVIPPMELRRGDANVDGHVNIGDPVYILNTRATLVCLDAADSDDNGKFESVNDAVYLLNHLFLENGTHLPGPRDCGADPTDDSLTCEEYSPCEP